MVAVPLLAGSPVVLRGAGGGISPLSPTANLYICASQRHQPRGASITSCRLLPQVWFVPYNAVETRIARGECFHEQVSCCPACTSVVKLYYSTVLALYLSYSYSSPCMIPGIVYGYCTVVQTVVVVGSIIPVRRSAHVPVFVRTSTHCGISQKGRASFCCLQNDQSHTPFYRVMTRTKPLCLSPIESLTEQSPPASTYSLTAAMSPVMRASKISFVSVAPLPSHILTRSSPPTC